MVSCSEDNKAVVRITASSPVMIVWVFAMYGGFYINTIQYNTNIDTS